MGSFTWNLVVSKNPASIEVTKIFGSLLNWRNGPACHFDLTYTRCVSPSNGPSEPTGLDRLVGLGVSGTSDWRNWKDGQFAELGHRHLGVEIHGEVGSCWWLLGG